MGKRISARSVAMLHEAIVMRFALALRQYAGDMLANVVSIIERRLTSSRITIPRSVQFVSMSKSCKRKYSQGNRSALKEGSQTYSYIGKVETVSDPLPN